MESKKNKNITKEQEKQFEKLNSIHPTKLKPNEKYEFNLLLFRYYFFFILIVFNILLLFFIY